jgi:hypothetical protein
MQLLRFPFAFSILNFFEDPEPNDTIMKCERRNKRVHWERAGHIFACADRKSRTKNQPTVAHHHLRNDWGECPNEVLALSQRDRFEWCEVNSSRTNSMTSVYAGFVIGPDCVAIAVEG